MSWKTFSYAAALAALVSPALAQPTVSVNLLRNPSNNRPILAANGNWQWVVQADVDASLFNVGQTSQSVSIELGLQTTGAALVAGSAAVDPTNVVAGIANPGAPITGFTTAPLGNAGLNSSGNQITAFLGSELLTDGAKTLFTFQTAKPSTASSGASLTTGATLSGSYGGNGRIAQDGANFNNVNATRTVVVNRGDANFDGRVNFQDVAIITANLNQASGRIWTTGDFTGNGGVNFQDVAVLTANLNFVGPAPVVGGANVPEPTSVSLLACLAGAGFALRRCRR